MDTHLETKRAISPMLTPIKWKALIAKCLFRLLCAMPSIFRRIRVWRLAASALVKARGTHCPGKDETLDVVA